MSQRKRKYKVNNIYKAVIQKRNLEDSLDNDFSKQFMIFQGTKVTTINMLSKKTINLLKKEKKSHIYNPIMVDFMDEANFAKLESNFLDLELEEVK